MLGDAEGQRFPRLFIFHLVDKLSHEVAALANKLKHFLNIKSFCALINVLIYNILDAAMFVIQTVLSLSQKLMLFLQNIKNTCTLKL